MRDIDGIDVLIEYLREQQKQARGARADGIVKPPIEEVGDEMPADAELGELEAMLAAEGGGAPMIGVVAEEEEDEDELER